MAKKKEIKKFKLNKWVKILVALIVLVITSIFILSRSTSEITFIGCGTDLPNYKYSLKFPFFWTFEQTMLDSASSYYEVSGPNSVFTVSCTNQGVGGDLCDEKYRIKFDIPGIEDQPCFGLVDGKWNMGVLNLSTDSVTNATIAFWSDGLEKNKIDKILSTFKRK